jgi:hypothetical protein
MPLPNISTGKALQCHAKAKHSGLRCKNPAVVSYGSKICRVCRVHGARRPGTIKRGEAHPNFKTGTETLEAKAQRSERLAQLRDIEATMVQLGALVGPRWRGRKPGKLER